MNLRSFLQPVAYSRHLNSGFTLTELVVVVSIISVLTAASIAGAINISRRAQALHIAKDMLEIKHAWETWVADGNTPYPLQSTYPPSSYNCTNEILIRDTGLFNNDTTVPDVDPNWNGPYLDTVPRDPWGIEYMYDNDGDRFDGNCPTTTPFRGVNVFLPFCISGANNRRGQYMPLAPMIDEIIDGGDGSCSGIFHWNPDPPLSNNNNGIFILMLSDNQ